jgi:hypothetical protein
MAEVPSDKPEGRITKPTKEIISQFTGFLREGVSLDIVCDFLGIQHRTCYEWIKKGKAYNAYPEGEPKYAIFGEFETALRKATAEYNIKMVRKVHTAEKGWSRDLAILERRDRRNYGKYDMIGGSGPLEQLDPDQKYI